MKPDKTSWDDEHKEFIERGQSLEVGDNWRFGFYQEISDESPPKTRIKDNSFYEFLVPEEHLSLKLFFDNFRNYAICAAFAALGAWLWLSPMVASLGLPVWVSKSFAIATWLLVLSTLLLNAAQTWFLSRELFLSIRAINIRGRIYSPRTNATLVLAFLHIITWIATDWIILLGIRLIAISLILLCMSFVFYAVVASPALQGAA